MLTGSVPKGLKDAEDLVHLWLDHNELEGSLPTELGRLDKLEWLALNHNKLTGKLPASMFGSLALKYLELHSNRFEGTVPSTIASMTELGMNMTITSQDASSRRVLRAEQFRLICRC